MDYLKGYKFTLTTYEHYNPPRGVMTVSCVVMSVNGPWLTVQATRKGFEARTISLMGHCDRVELMQACAQYMPDVMDDKI